MNSISRAGLIAAAACLVAYASPALAGASENCTVLAADVTPSRIPAGSFFKVCYRFASPQPLSTAYTVFVHFKNAAGHMVFQGDHMPSVGTGTPGWLGGISYEKRVIVPLKLAEGDYKILIGLYNKKGRASIKAGEGVVDMGDDSFHVGSFTVDRNAPLPTADTEKAPSLDLGGYRMSFDESFDGPLDVSPWGSGTRWIAHTPWAGDFGDAGFADPKPGFPFTIENGVLRIEARKDASGRWRAGLLSSNDPKGNGFSQKYGYFEMRAKMPPGAGVWPAFWLCSSYDRTDKKAGDTGAVEIDVIEYYGHSPNAYTCTMHVWLPKPHWGHGSTVTTRPSEVSTGFHDFGVMVQPDFTTMYFDKIEVWKTPTPEAHNKPLMLLVNLALGSGWPIDKTPNPSYMYVEHVRAWSEANPAPTISPAEGFIFGEPARVELACAERSARVYYTTDGSEPTRWSKLYFRPISVADPCTIKAVAIGSKYKPSAVSSVTFECARPADDPRNVSPGIGCRYYEGSWSMVPDFEKLTPAASGTAKKIDLSTRGRNDHIGFLFTGYIDIPRDGVYTFYTTSDDGSRLFIGDTMVVNNDGYHGMVEGSGMIGLLAGKHAISVDFFEGSGGEGLIAHWSGPGVDKQEIPPGVLYHAAQ